MLNLDKSSAVQFSEEEISHILSISHNWNDRQDKTKHIKHKISKHTLDIQNCKCAYCEELLLKGGVEVEHIANKAVYIAFTFEPLNLVSSCKSCNSTVNKGAKDTIQTYNSVYERCVFLIVHPFLDNPDEHILYKDKNKIVFDTNKCTRKGIFTIELFNWEEEWAKYQRIKNAVFKEKGVPIDKEKMIREISTYKI
jgi:uncharacterized protein (TIGR02646 family)